MIQLSTLWLTALAGTAIPLLVGLAMKSQATRLEKTLINLIASAVTGGLIEALATDGRVRPGAWLMGMLVTFGTSIVSHYNLWKPTGVTDKVINLLPDSGLGTAPGAWPSFLESLATLATALTPPVATEKTPVPPAAWGTGGGVSIFGVDDVRASGPWSGKVTLNGGIIFDQELDQDGPTADEGDTPAGC